MVELAHCGARCKMQIPDQGYRCLSHWRRFRFTLELSNDVTVCAHSTYPGYQNSLPVFHHRCEPIITIPFKMSPPIDPALLSALKPHCSGLGESFVGASGSRVLAEPSGHALFAKCTTPVAQVLGEAHSLNAYVPARPFPCEMHKELRAEVK